MSIRLFFINILFISVMLKSTFAFIKSLESFIRCLFRYGIVAQCYCLLPTGTVYCPPPPKRLTINHHSQFKKNIAEITMAELKLHLNSYSDMVHIPVQAVTPKPHTETFLKLDWEYKKRISKKNLES